MPSVMFQRMCPWRLSARNTQPEKNGNTFGSSHCLKDYLFIPILVDKHKRPFSITNVKKCLQWIANYSSAKLFTKKCLLSFLFFRLNSNSWGIFQLIQAITGANIMSQESSSVQQFWQTLSLSVSYMCIPFYIYANNVYSIFRLFLK